MYFLRFYSSTWAPWGGGRDEVGVVLDVEVLQDGFGDVQDLLGFGFAATPLLVLPVDFMCNLPNLLELLRRHLGDQPT